MLGDSRRKLRPFFILKPVVSGEQLYSMLGRVVEDPWGPHGPADFAPPENVLRNFTNLYRDSVPGKDIKTLKSVGCSKQARLWLANAVEAYTEAHYQAAAESRAAPKYKRWDIAQPKDEIKLLMQDPAYAKPVLEFLKKQKDRKAALVISVIALGDMKSSGGRQKNEHGAGGGIDTHLDAIALGANITAEIDASKDHDTTETKREAPLGAEVFAMGYVEIKLVDKDKKWYDPLTNMFGYPEPVGNVEVSKNLINPDTGLNVGSSHIKGELDYFIGPSKSPEIVDETADGEGEEDGRSDSSIRLYT